MLHKVRKLTREYRRARNINDNKNKRNDATAATLQAKSRACRKEILNVRTISRKKVIKLLRDLKDKAPRHYWRILKDCKREHINVPLQSFKDHFANLAVNFESSIDTDVPPVVDDIRNLDTNALNQPFTENEIRNFVKTLKNNKAVDIDGILN